MRKFLQSLFLLIVILSPGVTKAQVVECPMIDSLPYFIDFEDVPSYPEINAIPYCWTRINDAITYNYYPYVITGTANIIHGNRSLSWKTSPSPYYADNEYVVLPSVDQYLYDSLRYLSLSFYAKAIDTSAPWPVFIVGVMHDYDDTTTFVPVDTITLSPAITLYTVDFINYTDTGVLYKKTHYENGAKNGEEVYYDSQGNISKTIVYKDDRMVAVDGESL